MVPYSGNFRGRIGEKCDFRRENFHGLLAHAMPKDTTPPNFAEKTFTNSHKTAKFAKVFSFESFPLYSISSIHTHKTHMMHITGCYTGCMWECFWLSFTSFCSCVTLVASSMDSLRVLLLALVILGFILLISSSLHSSHKKHAYNNVLALRLVPLRI